VRLIADGSKVEDSYKNMYNDDADRIQSLPKKFQAMSAGLGLRVEKFQNDVMDKFRIHLGD
jgi:hypothetical protein